MEKTEIQNNNKSSPETKKATEAIRHLKFKTAQKPLLIQKIRKQGWQFIENLRPN